MRKLLALRLLLTVLLLCQAVAIGQDTASGGRVFRAGAATSNITPIIGAEKVGGWEPIPSKHIHDELHARCLVLDDGSTKVAFVVCDNVGIPREVFDAARVLAGQATGIPPHNT